MHLKRWLTAIVGIPLLVLIISFGGSLLFTLLIIVISWIALWEYFRIVASPNDGNAYRIIPPVAYITGVFILWAAYKQSPETIVAIIAFNLILCASVGVFCFEKDSNTPAIITRQVLGSVYIPLFLAYLILLRNVSLGSSWIFFLLAVIFAGDTGAYYVGSYFGRHKLCPAVSPKKTVEGALGGLAANLLIGALFKNYLMPNQSWWIVSLLFITMGVAGQVGDLFESQFKRVGGIKDSGTLLPGHGGILDRIDALLFAAPVVYYFELFFSM